MLAWLGEWILALWTLLATGVAVVAIGVCSVLWHEMRRASRERDDWRERWRRLLGDPRLEDDLPVREAP